MKTPTTPATRKVSYFLKRHKKTRLKKNRAMRLSRKSAAAASAEKGPTSRKETSMSWRMMVLIALSMILAWKLWYLIVIAAGFIFAERVLEYVVHWWRKRP